MKILNQKNKQIEKPSLEYYLNLQYPVTLYPDSEGGYVAQIKDLPGCLTQGETLEETMANINEARELWIETAHFAGDDIPLPSSDNSYSGKLLVRMPKSLHRRLAETAEREGVSLNQYIISLLSTIA
ncbi:type II toxin-antitoxin system HicB family antitoxin [Scytonema sp. NUACC26]|uniref:type II toxin-antitoxin system HicB family antitoxin n=1 Tax=Scytonema sp. NUACC26 TaxID=3140176 RepID=UPI0034DBC459